MKPGFLVDKWPKEFRALCDGREVKWRYDDKASGIWKDAYFGDFNIFFGGTNVENVQFKIAEPEKPKITEEELVEHMLSDGQSEQEKPKITHKILMDGAWIREPGQRLCLKISEYNAYNKTYRRDINWYTLHEIEVQFEIYKEND